MASITTTALIGLSILDTITDSKSESKPTDDTVIFAFDISASTGGPKSQIMQQMIVEGLQLSQDFHHSNSDFLSQMVGSNDKIYIFTFGGESGTKEFTSSFENIGVTLTTISDSSYNSRRLSHPDGGNDIFFQNTGRTGSTGSTKTHMAFDAIYQSNSLPLDKNIRLIVITDGQTSSREYQINGSLRRIKERFSTVKVEIVSVVRNYRVSEENPVGIDLLNLVDKSMLSSFNVTNTNGETFELFVGDSEGSKMDLFGRKLIIPSTNVEKEELAKTILNAINTSSKVEMESFNPQQVKNYLENFYQLIKRSGTSEKIKSMLNHFLGKVMEKKGNPYTVDVIDSFINKIFEREFASLSDIRVIRGQDVRRKIFSEIASKFNTEGVKSFLERAIDELCVLIDIKKSVVFLARLTDDLVENFSESTLLTKERFIILPDPQCPAMANQDFYRMLTRRVLAKFLSSIGYGQERGLQRSITVVKFVINLATSVLISNHNSPCKNLLQQIVKIMLNKEQVSRGATSESALTLVENGRGLPQEHLNAGISIDDVLFVLGIDNTKPSLDTSTLSFDVAPHIDGISFQPFWDEGFELSGVYFTKESKESLENSDLRCHLGNLYRENEFVPIPGKMKITVVVDSKLPDLNVEKLIGDKFTNQSSFGRKANLKSDSISKAIVFGSCLSSGKSSAIQHLLDIFRANGFEIVNSLDLWQKKPLPSSEKIVFHLSFDMISFLSGTFNPRNNRHVAKQAEKFIEEKNPAFVVADICYSGGSVIQIPPSNVINLQFMNGSDSKLLTQFCAYNASVRDGGFKSVENRRKNDTWFSVFSDKSGIPRSTVNSVKSQSIDHWKEGHAAWIANNNSRSQINERVSIFASETLNLDTSGLTQSVSSLTQSVSSMSVSDLTSKEIAEILIRAARGEIDENHEDFLKIPNDRDMGSGKWKNIRKELAKVQSGIDWNGSQRSKTGYVKHLKKFV